MEFTPACDGLTDGRTHDDILYRASIASRGKNQTLTSGEGETPSHTPIPRRLRRLGPFIVGEFRLLS